MYKAKQNMEACKGMKIALDYDGTFTLDPNLWCFFLGMCKARGHDVRIITMRKPEMPIAWPDDLNEGYKVPVIYTSNMQKREYCESVGFHVDIWIDDTPEFIVSRDVHRFLEVFNPCQSEKLRGENLSER